MKFSLFGEKDSSSQPLTDTGFGCPHPPTYLISLSRDDLCATLPAEQLVYPTSWIIISRIKYILNQEEDEMDASIVIAVP